MYKDIPGFTNYQITKDGTIWSKHYKKVLKHKLDRYGYYVINITNDANKRKYPPVHRLVAMTYIPNPEDKPQINHIDGNKLNNNVSNLEWVSAKENIVHSYSADLNKNHFYLTIRDLWLNTEFKYLSFKSAAKNLGFPSNVFRYLSKYSKINPIVNRFIVKVHNPNRHTSNALNFGEKVYIYDYIKQRLLCFPSTSMALYHTGIRAKYDNKYALSYLSIGYVIIENGDINMVPKNEIPIAKLKANRKAYVTTPYRPRMVLRKYSIVGDNGRYENIYSIIKHYELTSLYNRKFSTISDIELAKLVYEKSGNILVRRYTI